MWWRLICLSTLNTQLNIIFNDELHLMLRWSTPKRSSKKNSAYSPPHPPYSGFMNQASTISLKVCSQRKERMANSKRYKREALSEYTWSPSRIYVRPWAYIREVVSVYTCKHVRIYTMPWANIRVDVNVYTCNQRRSQNSFSKDFQPLY